jgi:hypothetical protein
MEHLRRRTIPTEEREAIERVYKEKPAMVAGEPSCCLCENRRRGNGRRREKEVLDCL